MEKTPGPTKIALVVGPWEGLQGQPSWFYPYLSKWHLAVLFFGTRVAQFKLSPRVITISFRDSLRAFTSLSKLGIKVVLCRGVINGIMACVLARFTSKKPTIVIQDFIGSIAWARRYANRIILRQLFSPVSLALCYTNEEKDAWVDIVGGTKVKLLEIGVSPSDYVMPTSDQGYIFSGGRSRRDFGTLFKAVSGVKARVFVAADYDPFDGKLHVPHAVPNNVRVELKLTQKEFKLRMAHCSFVVVPLTSTSLAAGSEVVLQAMAMGKAVIATSNPGVANYVSDGETGFLIPPADSDTLRSRIELLLRNRQLTQVVGDNGRRRVVSLSFIEVADQFVQMLTPILDRG